MTDRLGESLVKVLGDRTAKALKKMGLETVEDLLRHYPRRYVTRGELTDLASLRIGDEVTVLARISKITNRPLKQRKGSILDVVVTDGTGNLTLTFFNQAWRERELKVGMTGLFAGTVGVFNGKRQLTHPDFQMLPDTSEVDSVVEDFAGALLPVYPATAALPSWRIATSIKTVLDTLTEIDDPLPESVRSKYKLPTFVKALNGVHQPKTEEDWKTSRKRLAWDEAFTLQALLLKRRAETQSQQATPRVIRAGGLLDAFDQRLPFDLTKGQREVSAEIETDLAADHPMHRLLQGEVGSGKTIVALRAMLAVVDAGGQAALLAPTEVLAQQHFRSITAMLGDLAMQGMLGGGELSTKVVLLTGSQSTGVRKEALLDIASGSAAIVIGTHALIQEHVTFFDLGLVVVDEQHRFGVEQRDALRAKAAVPPHVLVMTATPIPRTVAMTVFGDLDVSTLRELPKGRAPIATHVVSLQEQPHYLDRAWQRIKEEVGKGHQAYVVASKIGNEGEDSENTGTSVLELLPMLSEKELAGLRIAPLHGRMSGDDKDQVMREFAAGNVDVLVATTVIEVGVDVPNATMMVVMDADRFGVSQLHQLRGRVGRGSAAGLCLLVTSTEAGSAARERLDAVASTLDGFELSQVDLEQRREGDVLGTAQSGSRSHLRILQVLRDEELIAQARDEARLLLATDPTLASEPALAAEVARLEAQEEASFVEKA